MTQFIYSFQRATLFVSSTALLAVLLILTTSSNGKAELVDRVVAVVNDTVITMSEVDQEGRVYFRRITETASADNLTAMLTEAREKVLNGLIDKALIKYKAKEYNIRVSDGEVERAIKKIIAKNNLTPKQFKEKLEEGGVTVEAYRDNLKSQLLKKKLIGFVIHAKIVVTDDMVLDYYDTHYTKHLQEDEYYLLQIGFTWEDSDMGTLSRSQIDQKREEARKRAERVQALAKQGNDFRELARKFSDLPSAEDGGDIGVFKKEDMAEDMSKSVTSLKHGEVSEIIETPAGFQFFKLLSGNDKSIVTKNAFESVKKDIKEKLYQQKLQEQYKAWITQIKEKAYIQKL